VRNIESPAGVAGLPAGHPPLISYAAIPIYVGGVVVGSVNLANRKGGFTPDLLPPLRTFATLLGGVMIMFENRDRCAPQY
jgi:GAF domain-containing protein